MELNTVNDTREVCLEYNGAQRRGLSILPANWGKMVLQGWIQGEGRIGTLPTGTLRCVVNRKPLKGL